jgi:hypothetical protein
MQFQPMELLMWSPSCQCCHICKQKEDLIKTQGLNFTLHSKATGSRSHSYDTGNLHIRAKQTTANWIFWQTEKSQCNLILQQCHKFLHKLWKQWPLITEQWCEQINIPCTSSTRGWLFRVKRDATVALASSPSTPTGSSITSFSLQHP